jgi:hypothetical protein
MHNWHRRYLADARIGGPATLWRTLLTNTLPQPILPKQVERTHDSAARHPKVVFRVQDAPPGMKVLGFELVL